MSKSHIHNTYTHERVYILRVFFYCASLDIYRNIARFVHSALLNQLDALRANVVYIYIQTSKLSHEYFVLSYAVLFFCISFLFFYNFILCIEKIICVFCAIVSIIDARFAAAIGLSTEFPRYLRYFDGGREYLLLFCLILECV